MTGDPVQVRATGSWSRGLAQKRISSWAALWRLQPFLWPVLWNPPFFGPKSRFRALPSTSI